MMTAYLSQLGSISAARTYDLVYAFCEAALIGPAVIEPLIASARNASDRWVHVLSDKGVRTIAAKNHPHFRASHRDR